MTISDFLFNIAQAKSALTYQDVLGTWPDGSPHLDQYGTQHAPTVTRLINMYRNQAYYCANINARAVACTPLRLFAVTGQEEAPPRGQTRQLNRRDRESLMKRVPSSSAIRLARARRVDEVMSHPALSIVEQGDAALDGFQLMLMTGLSLDIAGNAF